MPFLSDPWVGVEVRRRASILSSATLAAAVLTLGLAAARWAVEGPQSQIAAIVCIAAVLFSAAHWIVSQFGALGAGGNLLLGTALTTLWTMSLLEGGLGSEAVLWMPFVVLSCSFFQRPRAVVLWGALTLLAVISICVRDFAVADQPDRGLVLLHGASAIGVILFAGVLGWSVELNRTRTQQSIVSSELRRVEEQHSREALEKERVAAVEAVRARDEFVSIASHELNTPLTSLRLTVDVLHRTLPPDARGSTALARIERQVDKLSRLTDELLSVSRIDAGRLHLQLEPVDLVAVAHDVIERFGEEARRVHSALRLRAPSTLIGEWDRLRLDQVLSNLVSNALKYGRGQPVEIEAAKAGSVAHLTVTDHGIGIPPERLPHIFERFERAVAAGQYSGLGLGLYIVRQITLALGGSVRAESTPGTGSVFTLDLPLVKNLPAQ
jgi:signal transduction histidine kinase